ncbi:MAG: glycosyltransferase [Christensenellaceae bacterium]
MSVYDKETAANLSKSLMSIATQTYPPKEIVLVCDGALTQGLEETIQAFRQQYTDLLQLVRIESNVGLGEALNQGLQHCQNEYVARMDSDDIALPERIEQQLYLMLKKPLDICGCNIVEFQDENIDVCIKQVPSSHSEILKYAKKRNPFNHPSVVFRKTVILDAGGYQAMPYFEDYYLWVRALQRGARCGNLPQVLLRMRSNAAFYNRRGGIGYARHVVAFWKQLAKIGFITRLEAYVTIIPRLLSAIVPNQLRIQIYRHLLRS